MPLLTKEEQKQEQQMINLTTLTLKIAAAKKKKKTVIDFPDGSETKSIPKFLDDIKKQN